MPRKPISIASDQLNLADQFAAPDLYRNDTELIQIPKETRLQGVDQNGKRREPITCIEVRERSRSAILMGLDSFPFHNDPIYTERLWVQKVRFYCDRIVRYPVAVDSKCGGKVSDTSRANLTRGVFKGYISTESGRVIRNRLEAWIKSVQVNRAYCGDRIRPKHSQIVFATLTLPSDQVHGDNEIKRACLMPFIQMLKRNHGVENYFWSAEPQENGNVHFHCLFDRYVRAERLRDQWNQAVNALGYLNRYFESTGSCSPPSTRINVCPESMSLVKYVMKYVSKQPQVRCSLKEKEGIRVKRVSYWAKEEIKGGVLKAMDQGYDVGDVNIEVKGSRVFRYFERRPIEGRSWGCSKGLVGLSVYSSVATYRIHDICTLAFWDPGASFFKFDRAEVFYLNTYDFLQRHDPVLLADYRRYYLKLYADLYLTSHATVDQPTPIIPLKPDPPPDKVIFSQSRMMLA